jgi:hypothetical protein
MADVTGDGIVMMMSSRRWLMVGLAFAGLATVAARINSANASSEIYVGSIPDVGASGFDVVAYVRQGRATEGSSTITHPWRGVIWRFASAANRDAFAAAPERYAPAYGGHCSWAAAQGYKAKGDPQNWKIVGGRLFLNYNSEVQQKWETDIPGFISSADGNWQTLRQK